VSPDAIVRLSIKRDEVAIAIDAGWAMKGRLGAHLVKKSILLFTHTSNPDPVGLVFPINVAAVSWRGTIDSHPGIVCPVVVKERLDGYVPLADLATSSCKGFCAFVEAAHGSVVDVQLHGWLSFPVGC